MRILVAMTMLASLAVAPAARADWQPIGSAPRGLGTDGQRWAILVSGESGQVHRSYDTRAAVFGATITLPLNCSMGPIAHGRALVSCRDEQRRISGYSLFDLATGRSRPLHRRGDRRGMANDALAQMGRYWAGGLSCPSHGQRTCPQVYVNLRTGQRRRFNDLRFRDLDSPRLRRIPVPPHTWQTGPPDWRLVLRRAGKPDVTLRTCESTKLCWWARVHGDAAIWNDEDRVVHVLDVHTGRHRTYPLPAAATGDATPFLTRSSVLVVVPDGTVHLTAR